MLCMFEVARGHLRETCSMLIVVVHLVLRVRRRLEATMEQSNGCVEEVWLITIVQCQISLRSKGRPTNDLIGMLLGETSNDTWVRIL